LGPPLKKDLQNSELGRDWHGTARHPQLPGGPEEKDPDGTTNLPSPGETFLSSPSRGAATCKKLKKTAGGSKGFLTAGPYSVNYQRTKIQHNRAGIAWLFGSMWAYKDHMVGRKKGYL